MAQSIKNNYLLNLINTILGIVFPLITFPYSSRILMADGIGQVNFFNSIINYISLFSALGIPLYAIREAARVRDDNKQLSITTTEIFILHIFLSAIGYVAVAVISFSVTKVQENIPLFLLLSTSIILSTIGVNWFYQGVEEFKFITVRNIIVKIITIILLFVLVHKKDDLLWYALILVVGNVGNNIFNFFQLRKYISLKQFIFKDIHPLHHLKPALKIWVLNLVVSIYTQLDIIMLGFMQDPQAVGYFTAAHSLTIVLLSIATSLGTVLLPRLSNLVSNGNNAEFQILSQKAVDFIMMISIPLTGGIIVMAPTLIQLFCGSKFEPSILCLQIQAPIIIIIALSNVIGIQILYPQGKENLVTLSTFIGAIFNLLINLFLIPVYSQDAAAFGTVIAEIVVTCMMIIIGKKYVPVTFISIRYLYLIISGVVMSIVCYYLMSSLSSDIYKIIIIPVTGAIVYSLLIVLKKDPLAIEILKIITKRIKR